MALDWYPSQFILNQFWWTYSSVLYMYIYVHIVCLQVSLYVYVWAAGFLELRKGSLDTGIIPAASTIFSEIQTSFLMTGTVQLAR